MSSDQDHLQETDTEARFEFKKEEKSAFETEKGLTEETVRLISEDKDEPEWMLERRLRALEQYQEMPMPTDWPGQPDLSEVDIDEIVPYIRPDIETRGGCRGRSRRCRPPTGRAARASRSASASPGTVRAPAGAARASTRVRPCLPR